MLAALVVMMRCETLVRPSLFIVVAMLDNYEASMLLFVVIATPYTCCLLREKKLKNE